MDAYCVKCKTKREIQGEHTVTMRNGRKAARGKCKVCGTGLNAILPGAATRTRTAVKRAPARKRTASRR